MFGIICRRRPTWVLPKARILLGPLIFDSQIAVFLRSFSSEESSPCVCRNVSEKSFTISYLISTCGLSSKDALSVSKKVRIKSPENPDSVLELLRNYGFTDAHIPRLVARLPKVLSASPEKTLLPKLEFLCSIGAQRPILADQLSFHPAILRHSLKNNIIPCYNTLKSVLQSDKRVVRVFLQATREFGLIPSKIALFRERGLPESSIAYLLSRTPSMMHNGKEKLVACIDRAAVMGFDKEKSAFAHAIIVFGVISESKLKHKMDVYRKCGWSESDFSAAFLKHPFCMAYSEKRIMAIMDFLVNKIGLNPVDVAQRPTLLSYSLEKRLKPRFLVARILSTKWLKISSSTATFLTICEEKFVKKYIVGYQDDIPQLLNIYRGKLSLSEMGFSQDVIEKIQPFER